MHATPRHPARQRSAYTLIEVLVVVAVLGILGAAVVPNMLTAGSLGVQAAARIIVADILFAQNEAIAAQATRKVVFDPDANSYSLLDENGNVLTANWIAGKANNYVVDFDKDQRFQGVTITAATFNGTTTLEYNDLGGPVNGGTVVIKFNKDSYRINVAAFTGRVTVDKL